MRNFDNGSSEADKTDRISGRIFEYLWHVIFSMQPVQ